MRKSWPPLIFQPSPVRVPYKGQENNPFPKPKVSPKTNRISDLENGLSGTQFGSRELKISVVTPSILSNG